MFAWVFPLWQDKVTFRKHILLTIEAMKVVHGHGRFLWLVRLVNLSQGMLFYVLMCIFEGRLTVYPFEDFPRVAHF